jgi:hypothetical protein
MSELKTNYDAINNQTNPTFDELIKKVTDVYENAIVVEDKLNELKNNLSVRDASMNSSNVFLINNLSNMLNKKLTPLIQNERYSSGGDDLLADEINKDMKQLDYPNELQFGMEKSEVFLKDKQQNELNSIFRGDAVLKLYNRQLDEMDANLNKLFELLNITEFDKYYTSKLNMYINQKTKVNEEQYTIHNELETIYYINDNNEILFDPFNMNNIKERIQKGRQLADEFEKVMRKKIDNLTEKIQTRDEYNIKSTVYNQEFFDDLKNNMMFQIGGLTDDTQYYDDANIYSYNELYPKKKLLNEYVFKLSDSYKKYNILMDKINTFNELLTRYFNFRYYLFRISTEKYTIIDTMNFAVLQYYYKIISEILTQINKNINVNKNAYFDAYHLVTLNYLKYNIAPLIGIEFNIQNIDHEGLVVAGEAQSITNFALLELKQIDDPEAEEDDTTKKYTNLYVKLDKNIFYLSHFKILLDRWVVRNNGKILVSFEEQTDPCIIFPNMLNLDLFHFLSGGDNNVKLWINNSDYKCKPYIIARKILKRTLSLIPFDQCKDVKLRVVDVHSRVPYIAPDNYSKYKLPIHKVHYEIVFDYNLVTQLKSSNIKRYANILEGKKINIDNIVSNKDIMETTSNNFIRIIKVKILNIHNKIQTMEIMFPFMKKYEQSHTSDIYPEYRLTLLNELKKPFPNPVAKINRIKNMLDNMYTSGEFDERNSFEFVKWVNSELFGGNNETNISPPTRITSLIAKELIDMQPNYIKYYISRLEEVNFNKSRSLMNSFLGEMKADNLIWLEVKI